MPDIRKPLRQLYDEWRGCTRCSLGERRKATNGAFVFGEGTPGGILFLGEGSGGEEEIQGRPFIGESGQLLRRILGQMGLREEHYYITNLVACRSCVPWLGDDGEPRFRYPKKGPPIPMVKDEPPLTTQISACRDRLNEQIFLVDPVVIVTLGGEASSVLAGRTVAITNEHGQTFTTTVPGASFVPVLTEKKKAWLRVHGGEMSLPTKPNEVEYFVVPALHPAYVLRKRFDEGQRSPMRQLCQDIWLAVQIYERYLREGFRMDSPFQAVPNNFDYERTRESQ